MQTQQNPQRHQVALDMLVEKLRQDRYVLAAILFGSLVRGEAWEKSDIDLVAVLRDGVERERRGYWLQENGVSIWLETVPRNQLKQQFERSLPGTIRHAMHSQARLLFSHDDSIASWLERTERIGGRDQAYQLLRDALGLPYLLEKAEKWLYVKRDTDYCFVWLLQAVSNLARIEVTLHGEAPRREVLDLSIEEAVDFFRDERLIRHKLGTLNDLGLGYLKVGHPATKLSGGEAQRIKLGHQLAKIKRGKHNIYLLDEPTTGLHLADIQKLLDSLNRLVDAGHTVVIIEHHLDVIKTADHVIDLGPGAGHRGGAVVACGTPETVARTPGSHTGRYLGKVLG